MSNFKIVVLAANCFSGQDLVDLLLDDPNKEVIGVGRSPEKGLLFARYQYHKNISNFRYYQLDLNRDMDRISELMHHEKPDWVINFVAQGEVSGSWEKPGDWFQTNSVAVSKLVRCLCDYRGLKKYLHISTPEVYGSCTEFVTEEAPGNPSTPYAASKLAGDSIVQLFGREYGLPVLTVRATNVYGARQQLYRIIPRSIIYPKLGRKIQLHDGGNAVRSYIHIRDVSHGELAILERGINGEVYHLSPEKGVSIRSVVQRVCEETGVLFDEVTEISPDRIGQDSVYTIDSSKVRKELGWSPTVKFQEGIKEVVNWIDKNWDHIRHLPLEYEHNS